jgi:hypothetical protein
MLYNRCRSCLLNDRIWTVSDLNEVIPFSHVS